jgi:hypothetical protein
MNVNVEVEVPLRYIIPILHITYIMYTTYSRLKYIT